MAAFFWVVVLALTALGLTAIGYTLWRVRRRAVRRERFQRQFGAEYDRAVEETGSGDAARRELRARVRRVAHFPLRALGDEERARFSAELQAQRTRFVDDPARAVEACEELLQEVLRARGYPPVPLSEQLADLSVHHASIVDDYRRARALSRGAAQGRVSLEQLREAMGHYRVVLAALIESGSAR